MSTQTAQAEDTKNHLAGQASPYLLQHVHNPVDWYPWGAEALERARSENKPIILSVGYSTCYWCHVMEREVFEHEDVAAIMNENFINIKVDREERPDLDEMYMLATQMITGRGGWPNNVLLTPDLKPFFAVTYLPRDQWKQMLGNVAQGWKKEPAAIKAQGQSIMTVMKKILASEDAKTTPLPSEIIDAHFEQLMARFDREEGGFSQAPKFPNETELLFLLDYAASRGNSDALEAVQLTLDKMMLGGLHDHIGGGFHRYCVDGLWHVPHFEKMLYNQALLARTYHILETRTDEPAYTAIVEGIFDFLDRQLTNEEGAFLSAIDAETDAVEGAYYVWNETELSETLGPEDFSLFFHWFKRAEVPEISGHKHPDGGVIYQPKSFAALAAELNKEEKDVQDTAHALFEKLRNQRDKRPLPRIDDKIIAGWNGLMIDAAARTGRIEHAEKAMRFILNEMRDEQGNLYRIYAAEKAYQSAFFEDYAFLIQGLASLYRASDDEFWPIIIDDFVKRTETLFVQENGKYAMTAGAKGSAIKITNAHDSAIPSAAAVLTQAFLDLYEVTRKPEWLEKAGKILQAYASDILKNPQSYGHMIHGFMRYETLKTQKTQPGMQSKDRVKTSAFIEDGGVSVVFEMDEGWHINANPAALDFLIATTVSADGAEAAYPDPQKMQTPLGIVTIYQGKTQIALTFKDDETDLSSVKIQTRFQACSEDTCLAPSNISIKPH